MTYTLTGANTGETALDRVVITDDLSGVLRLAFLRGEVTATVGDREVAAPVIEGDELSWHGALRVGESVTITYAVTVRDSAASATLKNVAKAHATAPGGAPITPPASATEHPVLTPLALTGMQLAPWLLGLSLLLVIGGAALLLLRRRDAESTLEG